MSSTKLLKTGVAFIFATLFFIKTGQTKLIKSETASDIIEKAQNLSLQKERSQAILLLVNAIKRESKKNAPSTKDLQAALERIATIFYSDKAQQLYELGISLKNTDPNLALNKLGEALKIEADNQSIILEQNRIQIAKGECSLAAGNISKHRTINPFSEQVDLLYSQALVCAGQFEPYKQQFRQKFEDKKSAYHPFWGMVEAEYQFKSGQNNKVREISNGIFSKFSVYPEPLYWLWKAENSEESANKYLNLCKSLTVKVQREFMLEPMLCRRTAEIEVFLKKINNQN